MKTSISLICILLLGTMISCRMEEDGSYIPNTAVPLNGIAGKASSPANSPSPPHGTVKRDGDSDNDEDKPKTPKDRHDWKHEPGQ